MEKISRISANRQVELIGLANRAERAISALRRLRAPQLKAGALKEEIAQTEQWMSIIMRGLNERVLEPRPC